MEFSSKMQYTEQEKRNTYFSHRKYIHAIISVSKNIHNNHHAFTRVHTTHTHTHTQHRNGHPSHNPPTHRRPPLSRNIHPRTKIHPTSHPRHGSPRPRHPLLRPRRIPRGRIQGNPGVGPHGQTRNRAVETMRYLRQQRPISIRIGSQER